MGLFYSNDRSNNFLDPHKVKSQTWYVFNCNGIVISWRYFKPTIVATLSNHSKIIAIHEASRECI